MIPHMPPASQNLSINDSVINPFFYILDEIRDGRLPLGVVLLNAVLDALPVLRNVVYDINGSAFCAVFSRDYLHSPVAKKKSAAAKTMPTQKTPMR